MSIVIHRGHGNRFYFFLTIIFLQKSPIHPGAQLLQAPLKILHLGFGQSSVQSLSQLFHKHQGGHILTRKNQ